MIHERAQFSTVALRMSSGVIVWALHFAVIYGYTGLACARRYVDAGAAWTGAVPWVIGIATAIAVVILVPHIARLARTRRPVSFVEWMRGALSGLALIAVVFEAVPVLMVPVCA